MKLAAAIGPLEKVTRYMNEATDLPRKKATADEMIRLTHERHEKLLESNGPFGEPGHREPLAGRRHQCAMDMISLQVEGLHFHYFRDGRKLTADGLEAPQGSMVAV